MLAASGLRLHARHRARQPASSASTSRYIGTNLSPALLGVGYIVGLNIGDRGRLGQRAVVGHRDSDLHAYFLQQSRARGAIAETCQLRAMRGGDAQILRGAQIRYLGVGAMLVGGIWTLFSLRHSLVSGVRSGLAATRAGSDAS